MKNCIVLAILVGLLTGCSNSPAPTGATEQPAAAAPASTTKAPDENAALDTVRKINEAQTTHFKMNRRFALSFDELVQARLLGAEPSPAQTGYEFRLRPAADAQTYKLSVVPEASAAAARSFYVDETGSIRAESGKEATAESPEVK